MLGRLRDKTPATTLVIETIYPPAMPRKTMYRRRLQIPALVLPVAPLSGLALLGAVRGISMPTLTSIGYPATAAHCGVVDGDTLRCDGGRIRLLGSDAPERPGPCAQGRLCAPGDPVAATRSLRDGLGSGRTVKIREVGTDR